MTNKLASRRISKIQLEIALLLAASLTGCIDPNASHYPSSYGNTYGDPYYRERRDINRDRRELDRERDRIEAEQRRLEYERDRVRDAQRYSPPPPPPPPQRRQESCPSGFSPSEQKCSSDERRRGCRDMRLPGGLGCVSR
jgi:hypothetical protein